MLFYFILLPVLYLIVSFINKNRRISPNDPKRPWSLPILGSLHSLGDSPHHGFAKLAAKYGDVYGMYMGDTYTIVFQDPAAIKEIWVKNHDTVVNRYHTPTAAVYSNNYTNIVSADYERWTLNRGLVSPTFTKLKVKSMHSTVVQNQCTQLLNHLITFSRSNQLFKPRLYLKKYTMNIITRIAFGFDSPFDKDSESFKSMVEKMDNIFEKSAPGNLGDYISFVRPLYFFQMKIGGTAMGDLRAHIKTLYDDHMTNLDESNPKDLMDEMIIQSKGVDNELAILSIGCDLMLAGTDTTAGVLEWFFQRMLQNPDVQDKVYNELLSVVGNTAGRVEVSHRNSTPYTVAVIKEVLRINPVAPIALSRSPSQDMTYKDYFIPKGSQLILNIYGVHMNEKIYDNPHEFKPERFLVDPHTDSWLPFGIGQRNCVGMNLALDEIYIAASNMLLNFKFRPTAEAISFKETFGLTVHPSKEYAFYLDARPTTTLQSERA